MEEIIEQLARREIRDLLADTEDTIKEAVKTLFFSELRAAIRDSISDVLQDISKEPDTIKEPSPLSKEAKMPDSALTSSQKTEDKGQKTEITPQKDSTIQSSNISHPLETEIPIHDEPEPREQGDSGGRYIYCVVKGSEEVSFGRIGIEENEVYTIPYEDISAVVHNCPTEPYQSEDEEIMKNWVMVHQSVIDQALERFDTVLPLGFDTIIQGNETASPEENMKNWLKEDYDNLKRKIEKISGKAEYGVQVFWDPKIIAKNVTKDNPEIKKLDEEIKSKPKGMAYMYTQKLKDLIKKEMEGKADQDFKEFFEKVKSCVDEIQVEKTKKAEDERQMLMNLSCLLPKEASRRLGDVLEKISNTEGYSVRFTGPWPAYSFV